MSRKFRPFAVALVVSSLILITVGTYITSQASGCQPAERGRARRGNSQLRDYCCRGFGPRVRRLAVTRTGRTHSGREALAHFGLEAWPCLASLSARAASLGAAPNLVA